MDIAEQDEDMEKYLKSQADIFIKTFKDNNLRHSMKTKGKNIESLSSHVVQNDLNIKPIFVCSTTELDHWAGWDSTWKFGEVLSNKITKNPQQKKSFYQLYEEFVHLLKRSFKECEPLFDSPCNDSDIRFLIALDEQGLLCHPVIASKCESGSCYSFSFHHDLDCEKEHDVKEHIVRYPHDYHNVWRLINAE